MKNSIGDISDLVPFNFPNQKITDVYLEFVKNIND